MANKKSKIQPFFTVPLAILVLGLALYQIYLSMFANQEAYYFPQSGIGGGPEASQPSSVSAAISNPQVSLPADKIAITVTYTDQGFNPKTVTIKKGQAVKWVNSSIKNEMWIITDPHPQHSDYPEFNQQQGVSLGGEYGFIFATTGIWKYHNELAPQHTGEIIVQ